MRTLAFLLVALLGALQAKLWFGEGGLLDNRALATRVKAQKEDNAHLRERNQALEEEVRDLKEGFEALEERARSEMGMVKEGEVFYQVIEPLTRSAGAASP